MKKLRMALPGLALAAATLLSFKASTAPSIKGKVTPAHYAVHAWAINETDTLYTTINDGNFEFSNVDPGVYRIVVEARSPYRHMAKDNVVVKSGEETDVALSLQKY